MLNDDVSDAAAIVAIAMGQLSCILTTLLMDVFQLILCCCLPVTITAMAAAAVNISYYIMLFVPFFQQIVIHRDFVSFLFKCLFLCCIEICIPSN